MTYNRDLQEDKRIVFHADDTLAGSLDALGGMLSTAEFHTPPPSDWVTALDLAETLVARGVPFRVAHHLVGGLVTDLVSRGESFVDLTEQQLTEFDSRFEAADLATFDVTASVAARSTHRGGSIESVEAQIQELEAFLALD
jgi:argininosuccinate lyase